MVKSISLAIVFQSFSVAVHSFIINYSTPRQCGDVEISWTKPSTSAAQLQFPLILYILPFNSIAVSQQIHGWNASMTSGSAVVNFNINLISGAGFLLGVTDQTGRGVGRASEVKTVTTSQDMSCLSTNTTSPPNHFQILTTSSPSDCPSLSVIWDGSVKSPRPTILGFSPGESPVNMDPPSSPLPVGRSVSINGTFTSMSRVVVLFRDSDSFEPSGTSQFLTVGGMDRDGCSTLPSSSLTSTLPPCDLRCSNESAGRVAGGVLAGLFCFAILLFAIFVYCRRRYRAAQGALPNPEEISSTKSMALSSPPPPPPKTSISSENRPVSLYIAPTSTKFGPSNENDKQQGQEQGNEGATTTTPTSSALSHSSPLPLPTSPLSKRRSWTSRSMSTDETAFLQFTEASIFFPSLPNEPGSASPKMYHSEGAVSRPDSPTLPESKSRHASANSVAAGAGVGLPSNPRTPRPPKLPKPAARPRSQRSQWSEQSERSQQSERRENYLKLDPTSDITIIAGEVSGSRRASSRMSRKTQWA